MNSSRDWGAADYSRHAAKPLGGHPTSSLDQKTGWRDDRRAPRFSEAWGRRAPEREGLGKGQVRHEAGKPLKCGARRGEVHATGPRTSPRAPTIGHPKKSPVRIYSLPVLLPVRSRFLSQFQICFNRTPSQPKAFIALW